MLAFIYKAFSSAISLSVPIVPDEMLQYCLVWFNVHLHMTRNKNGRLFKRHQLSGSVVDYLSYSRTNREFNFFKRKCYSSFSSIWNKSAVCWVLRKIVFQCPYSLDSIREVGLLQPDLNEVAIRYWTNGTLLNLLKYKRLSFSWRNMLLTNFYIGDYIIDNVSTWKGLRIIFVSNLKFNRHITIIVSKSK